MSNNLASQKYFHESASGQFTLSSVRTEIISLTPDLALQLLKINTSNRPLKARSVSVLAKAIKRGEWSFNGDAIRVSRSGRLLDGQHRCQAVVEAGIAVMTLLVTGLEDDVFSTIDRGFGRTTGDIMSIKGESNYIELASISRLVHLYETCGQPFSGNPSFTPSANQLLELVNANPSLRDSAAWVSTSKWARKYIPKSTLGFCHFVFYRKDAIAASSFFSTLDSGIGLFDGSPILLLRNRLDDSKHSNVKLATAYQAALIFKAFKHHRAGVSIKTLRIRTDGANPETDFFSL